MPDSGLPLVLSVSGAVLAFIWGAYQFLVKQWGQAESRRIEATKPFLDRQLRLYTEATQAAAMMATTTSEHEFTDAKSRFLLLFWGELVMVEDRGVEGAMVQFRNALLANLRGEDLAQPALALGRACRMSLAKTWGVKEWLDPHQAKPLAKRVSTARSTADETLQ
jgi:hypothetical protein